MSLYLSCPIIGTALASSAPSMFLAASFVASTRCSFVSITAYPLTYASLPHRFLWKYRRSHITLRVLPCPPYSQTLAKPFVAQASAAQAEKRGDHTFVRVCAVAPSASAVPQRNRRTRSVF